MVEEREEVEEGGTIVVLVDDVGGVDADDVDVVVDEGGMEIDE